MAKFPIVRACAKWRNQKLSSDEKTGQGQRYVVANSVIKKNTGIQEMDRKMRLDFGMQGNITRIGPAPAVRSTLDLEFVE